MIAFSGKPLPTWIESGAGLFRKMLSFTPTDAGRREQTRLKRRHIIAAGPISAVLHVPDRIKLIPQARPGGKHRLRRDGLKHIAV
jgi:hypothetical protein